MSSFFAVITAYVLETEIRKWEGERKKKRLLLFSIGVVTHLHPLLFLLVYRLIKI